MPVIIVIPDWREEKICAVNQVSKSHQGNALDYSIIESVVLMTDLGNKAIKLKGVENHKDTGHRVFVHSKEVSGCNALGSFGSCSKSRDTVFGTRDQCRDVVLFGIQWCGSRVVDTLEKTTSEPQHIFDVSVDVFMLLEFFLQRSNLLACGTFRYRLLVKKVHQHPTVKFQGTLFERNT